MNLATIHLQTFPIPPSILTMVTKKKEKKIGFGTFGNNVLDFQLNGAMHESLNPTDSDSRVHFSNV